MAGFDPSADIKRRRTEKERKNLEARLLRVLTNHEHFQRTGWEEEWLFVVLDLSAKKLAPDYLVLTADHSNLEALLPTKPPPGG